MPIYAYRCSACGHAKDMLRKLSDPPLTLCPACGGEGFAKQLTAAGFQLKGSGWYVTDFRGGNTAQAKGDEGGADKPAADTSGGDKAGDKAGERVEGKSEGKSDGKSEGKSETKPGGAATPKPAAADKPSAAPAPAPTAGS